MNNINNNIYKKKIWENLKLNLMTPKILETFCKKHIEKISDFLQETYIYI